MVKKCFVRLNKFKKQFMVAATKSSSDLQIEEYDFN